MLVLLWGVESDPPVAEVHQQLSLAGVPTTLLDQRRVLETEVDIVVGNKVEGFVRIGVESINLAEVTSVYVRPYESVRLAKIAAAGPESAAWRHAARVDDILDSWLELTSALVVNRCSTMCANGSKPYQLEQIRSLGWKVPETLITTDPEAAREFWRCHGEVVYKSVSGIRSRVSRLRPDHADRFSDLASCPTQFQQYISGADYRVHVVGNEVFACEVQCTADDYRYPGDEPLEIQACSLTPDLQERCRILAAAMNLPVAGIDLRRTPQGEWFCFEVNPSPAFTYYEHSAGQPIAQAVARLLANGQPDATSGIRNQLCTSGTEDRHHTVVH
jgi:ribosomal protein S6-L-glutamate ligase RimK-like protein